MQLWRYWEEYNPCPGKKVGTLEKGGRHTNMGATVIHF